MKYKNTGKTTKIRTPSKEGWKWFYVEKGQTVDIPQHIGEGYGFEEVEKPKPKEGRHGGKKIETKFKEKLTKVKGLGEKTADDLLLTYPDEESLKQAIKEGKQIPIRDDLAKKVEKKFK